MGDPGDSAHGLTSQASLQSTTHYLTTALHEQSKPSGFTNRFSAGPAIIRALGYSSLTPSSPRSWNAEPVAARSRWLQATLQVVV